MSPLEIYLLGAALVAFVTLADDPLDLIWALWMGIGWPLWVLAVVGMAMLVVGSLVVGVVCLLWNKAQWIRALAQGRPHSKGREGKVGQSKDE